MNVKNKEERNL